MVDTVRITHVELRAQFGQRSLYRITADNGTKYATSDVVLAMQCKTAEKSGALVSLHSAGGWWYRDLTHVELVPKMEASA